MMRALRAFFAAMGILALGTPAWVVAQEFPSRPVRIIVPLAAGGATDVATRVIAERLSERLGQPVVVENRAGAEGLIGVDAAAKSPPDGYTMVFGSSTTMAAIVSLFARLPFDPVRDFVPVAKALDNAWNALIVPAGLPVKDLKEFLDLARARPGQLNYGAGTASSKICIEMLKVMTGVNITLVPYKTSTQALNDLIAGQVQIVCEPVGTAIQNAKAGKVRALGVTSPAPLAEAAGVPTVAEAAGAPGYEHASWIAFFAPAGTPTPAVERLSTELLRVLAHPDMVARMKVLGFDVVTAGPAELGALQRATIARYAKVVKDAGIVPQ